VDGAVEITTAPVEQEHQVKVMRVARVLIWSMVLAAVVAVVLQQLAETQL
jgi:hypothetical protein